MKRPMQVRADYMALTQRSGREWAHLVCNEGTRTTQRLRGDVHAPEEGYSDGTDGKFIFFRRAPKRGSGTHSE